METLLTDRNLKQAITNCEAQIAGTRTYLSGLSEEEWPRWDRYNKSYQDKLLAMSGDPNVVLAGANRFIKREMEIPLSENFSEEDLRFYRDRDQLIKYHPRAFAILVRAIETEKKK